MNNNNFIINDISSVTECLKEAHQQIINLENTIEEYKWLEGALINRTRLFDKRDRELNCIFLISEYIRDNKNNPENIYIFIVNNLISGFQHPELTSVLISISNITYTSKNYFNSSVFYSSEILKEIGVLTVNLKSTDTINNSFLTEEIKLIEFIAYLISVTILK